MVDSKFVELSEKMQTLFSQYGVVAFAGILFEQDSGAVIRGWNEAIDPAMKLTYNTMEYGQIQGFIDGALRFLVVYTQQSVHNADGSPKTVEGSSTLVIHKNVIHAVEIIDANTGTGVSIGVSSLNALNLTVQDIVHAEVPPSEVD